MKQNNWQLSIVVKFFILLGYLTQFQNLVTLTFKQQQYNSPSARYHRPDSFARIHNRCHNLQELQLVTELASLHALQVPLNPEFAKQNLVANLPTNNSNNNSNSSAEKLPIYPDSYNPFTHGNLTETFYKLQAFLNSGYRESQETKYPYLAKQRYVREQQASLASLARTQARKQVIALDLIREYNFRVNNLHQQINSGNQAQVNRLAPYEIKLPEQFFNTKFSNSEQQLLHQQQVEIVCELADQELFPKNLMGLQDFSGTVLETVALAYQANRQELIQISKSFTNLAQDFMALGRGLARGGYNFASNITNTGSNLILHPINSSKAVANNIANLTKNVAMGLLRVLVILADVTDERNPEGMRPYILAAQDYGHERYQQFRNYIETVPREQKFEQVGEFVGEQTLSLAAGYLTGKTVALLSDSVIAAQLHKAIKIKNKTDKTKTKQISWLNKFGVPGKDVAQALGLVITEEYELATLDGLVVSFKNSPTNNQTLFNHAEEYFKHNKAGNRVKSKSVIKTSDEIKPARIIGHQKSLPELRLEAKELAAKMGFKETKDFSSNAHTEKIYKKGQLYISLDNKGHKGGFWKVFNRKQDRAGTYNKTLTELIGI